MKKILKRFLLLVLPVLALSSCKEKGIYTTFNTEYVFEATIPATTGITLPIDLFTAERESNFESQYSINDTRKDLVTEVELTGFFVEITDPQGEDFSFLNAVSFFIDADKEPEVKVAEKDPVPASVGNDLVLDVFSSNLAPYIKNDPFTIRLYAVTDETINNDITVTGTVSFRVRARLIGN